MQDTYKKILVAVDLSPISHIPIEKALLLARENDASLDIIHVVDTPSPYISQAYPSNVEEMITKEGKENLSKFCSRYGVTKESQHIVTGSPVSSIIEYAAELNCDLIVVGSHGDNHLLPAFLGSTASSLLVRVNCDVLTVSTHAKETVETRERIGPNTDIINA